MDFPPDTDDRDFNVSFDQQDHEGEYAGEFLEKKVDSLGWKVTLIAIIIPCLIGVVVALSYFSITKKVAEFQDTGSATVHELSSTYENKLSDMQKRLAEQEDAIGKKLDEIKRNAAAIKSNENNIKKTQDGIKDIQSSINNNQDSIKSLTTGDSKISATIGNLQKDMEKLTEAIGETSRQVLALRQKVEAVELRLTGLSEATAQKPDMEVVSRMVTDIEKTLKPSIDASANTLKSRLKSLEARIADLERKVGGSSQDIVPAPSMDVIEEEDLK